MKKILYLIIIGFLWNCSEKKEIVIPKQKIKSITLFEFGGKGISSLVKLTKDSIIYQYNTQHFMKIDSFSFKKSVSNANYPLEDIIHSNQLSHFFNLKNGKSNQPLDGFDIEITIETDTKTYSVSNKNEDDLWQNIEIQMEKILKKEF